MQYATEKSKRKTRFALYKCECCNKHIRKSVYDYKRRKSEYCKKCSISICNQKHNSYNTRLYKIWAGMKQRINNNKRECFKDYGGRGISYCEEWELFENFKSWALSNGYKDNLTIDRINNNGNYEPSNCRWTTRTIQNRNTRHLKNGYRGVTKVKDKEMYRSRISVDNRLVNIGTFNTSIEAAKAYDKYIIDNNLEHTKNFDIII